MRLPNLIHILFLIYMYTYWMTILSFFIFSVCVSYIVVKSIRHFFLSTCCSFEVLSVRWYRIFNWYLSLNVTNSKWLFLECAVPNRKAVFVTAFRNISVKGTERVGSYLNASFNPKVSIWLLTILSSLPL
jgi:hypothetical protein